MPFLANLKNSSVSFFRDIGRSCYDVEWYRQIRTRRWAEGLKYLAAFLVLLSVLTTAAIAPGIVGGLKNLQQAVAKNVPAGASFSVKGGKFSTTLPTPQTVVVDKSSVLIDPSLVGQEFPKDVSKETVAVIGSDAVFIYASDTERRVYALKDLPDFSVNKERTLDWIRAYGPWVAVGIIFLLFLVYFGTVLTGTIFYVLMTAILMMLAARLWKVRLSVGQFAAVGFHAVTLPTLVDLVTSVFGLHIPYAFSGIYFLTMAAVVMDERNRPILPGETDGRKPAEATRPPKNDDAGPKAMW